VRAEPRPLEEATVWLETYRRTLEQNFERLDALLEALKAAGPAAPAPTRSAAHPPAGRSTTTTTPMPRSKTRPAPRKDADR
jgi:hypothetical protein